MMKLMGGVKAAVVTVALVGGSMGTALASEGGAGDAIRAESTGAVDGTSHAEGASAYCWYETYCDIYGYCWTSWVCL
jgi:hypothetical protein